MFIRPVDLLIIKIDLDHRFNYKNTNLNLKNLNKVKPQMS